MFGNAVFRWRDEDVRTPPEPKTRRATLGVALGGGAARGWAHIGVFRALTEAGLVPDVITGTSIGAVVGGCYAAGELDNLEAFARSLTRRKVFGLLDLNFAGSGLISGNRLSRLLDARLKDIRIENLKYGYVAIATELGTGHEVWMSRGRLVDAMRASYSLPGIFQPVRLNGRWLVDGALVNPVPVSAARALGAEVVIAVNLQTDVFGRGTIVQDHSAESIAEQAIGAATAELPGGSDARRILRRQLIGEDDGPPGISAVMVEAFNIIQDRIARSRLAGDPPDLTIGPKLGKIGNFDFHRAAEGIDAGYEAARKMAAEIDASLLVRA
ncbi:MAG TPA: patatin-like phospholipase family protein [Bauldia sp.]|nr:patatin-like phospholipase family protein [Bauldia sp.]